MAKQKKRPRLTREQVLNKAVELADEGGLDSLSMRTLAAGLGVEAMSLYNHIKNKDDLLDGMADQVAGEIELPAADGNWKAEMRRRALSAHDVLMRHPWATMLLVSRANTGPNMLRYVDATITCIREAGFSWEMTDHAWNAIDSYIYGFTLQKLNFPFEPSEYTEVAKAYLPMIPAEQYPGLHGMTESIIAGDHDGVHELEFGLDLVLDGLEARVRES